MNIAELKQTLRESPQKLEIAITQHNNDNNTVFSC